MIEKIRRALIIKYTIVIACILFAGFAASYAIYRHTGIKILHDSLRDYSTEEQWEAEEYLRRGDTNIEVHKINADIKSMHNFAYWIAGQKIIRAEIPYDDVVAEKLEHQFLTRNYKNGKIYHENIKHNKQKWYFLVMKQTLPQSVAPDTKIFVVANYTPVRKNTRAYIKIAMTAAAIMTLLAYIIGSFFATKSMKYIEQSYQKQKQFVSDAAHELRTPLSILYSYAELLEYNPQNPKTISDLKDEIQQMNEMVNRLLAIARYDNARAILHKNSTDINALVKTEIEGISGLYPQGSFELKENCADISANVDAAMIRQLLGILLDNAAKYTGKDKEIKITLGKQKHNFSLMMEDNGCGISPEDLEHIFERFWRAEKSRHQSGLGLGLSLAETIVKLHKGKIEVKSRPDVGTTFEVTLPL